MQLEKDLKESNAKLAALKEERESVEQDALEKEQRASELLAKRRAHEALAATAREVSKDVAQGACGGCFDGITTNEQLKEDKMKEHLEKVQKELAASQDELSKARSHAEEARKDVTTQKSMFMRDVRNFRTATPANQREMRGDIINLLNQIQGAENELQEEKTLLELSKSDVEEHEKVLKKLEGKLDNDTPFAFMKATKSLSWLRTQTPAQQREIRNELINCLQDLEAMQVEKHEHEITQETSHRRLAELRKRTGSGEVAPAQSNDGDKNSAFAFKQGS